MTSHIFNIRTKLNRFYSYFDDIKGHARTRELQRHFCGKKVAVTSLGGKPCKNWTGIIDYVRYDPPTAHFCSWGISEARIVFGFAWDGEPDENGVEGIELIWGLDEIELI